MKSYFLAATRYILVTFFITFIKLNFYFGSAFILYFLTKKTRNTKKYRVLVLSKPIFNEDIYSISEKSKSLSFLFFPRLLLSEYVKHHFKEFGELNDSTYHKIMSGTVEQRKIFDSLDKLFPYLHRMLKFDLIFAGNYVYVSQQEFFKVAQKWKVPVVVLYKEGIFMSINPSVKATNNFFDNKRFYGDKLLFYNSFTENALLKAKVPGVEKKKTAVVGIPRLDKYHEFDNRRERGKNIALFSFESELKARRLINNDSKARQFKLIAEEFQLNLIRFCIENTDYSLTVKTKSLDSSKSSFNQLLIKSNQTSLPPNIKISHTDNPFELICNSDFVAGFFSTTLLESLILSKPVLVPFFPDISKNPQRDIFGNHPESVNYIEDYSKLEHILNGTIEPTLPSDEEKRKILEPFIHRLDGRASERVEKEIVLTLHQVLNKKNG